MKPSDLPFQTLCSFFNVVLQKNKTLKHKHLRHFREKFIERIDEDVFSIYRLLAPAVCLQASVSVSSSISLPSRWRDVTLSGLMGHAMGA